VDRKPRPVTITAQIFPPKPSLTTDVLAGYRYNALASSWLRCGRNRSRSLPPSDECDRAHGLAALSPYQQGGFEATPAGTPRGWGVPEISPCNEPRFVELACWKPSPRWAAHHPRDAPGLGSPKKKRGGGGGPSADGIVARDQPRTVQRSLHDVCLQPHRNAMEGTLMLRPVRSRSGVPSQCFWCSGTAAAMASQGHLDGGVR